MELRCRPATEEDCATDTLVKTSVCGVKRKRPFENPDRALFLAWNYQERCGLSNPLKRHEKGIKALINFKRG